MRTVLFSMVLTALCFGGWPLVARLAGNTGVTGTFIMAAVALVPIAIVLTYQGIHSPPAGAMWMLIAAGMVMGTGFIAYHFAIRSPQVDVSVTVPVISVLMQAVVVSGGVLFFHESWTLHKTIGIVLLIAAMVFLRPASPKAVPVTSTPPEATARAD